MTILRKAAVATAVILAAGLVYYQMRLTDNLRRQVSELKQQSTSIPAAVSPATQPMLAQEKLKQLEAANIALSNSLAQTKAVNANMNSAWLKAEQAYKELADKTAVSDPANRFPTARHVVAGIGSIVRRSTLLNASLTDHAELTPEQIKVRQAEAIALADDASAVMKASQSLDGEKKNGSNDAADDAACMLYGALDLNEQQFKDFYSIIQRLQDQAKAQNLWNAGSSPENQALLAKWNKNAQTRIQQILNPDQATLFQKISPSLLELFRSDIGMEGLSVVK